MPKIPKDDRAVELIHGDCLEEMSKLAENSIDTIITDPPYGLVFMGKDWDHGVPGIAFWKAALRVAKPGAMLFAFGGTRTVHRLTCAIEDAGWTIRDRMAYLYGCLSEDTEILVDGEWESCHKAIVGRHALCYNVGSEEYSWQPIEANYVYDYDDTAYRIQSNLTDQIVSRNHRCIVEQGRNYAFKIAEKIALERQASVPVLEGVQDLLCNLSMPYERTGNAKQNVFPTVYSQSNQRPPTPYANRATKYGMFGMWQDGSSATILQGSRKDSRLLLPMQRSFAGAGMGQTCVQGASSLDCIIPCIFCKENEWREQSSMEGRSDLLPQARQLQANQVCSVSNRVSVDGSQGRVHHGASVIRGASDGTLPLTVGSGASYQPRSDGQSAEKLTAIQQQPKPQAIRGARFTSATLASVTPIHYIGKVWCIKVPTGAFVARRNGKVFVTGNSGFPKSLDIGKKLDQMAGAEREVVGKHPIPCANVEATVAHGGSYQESPDITAPATPAAKLWDGYGTALKPAQEIIIVAMKPLEGTFAQNALKWGVAGLWIDGGRVGTKEDTRRTKSGWQDDGYVTGKYDPEKYNAFESRPQQGRWPANVLLDGSEEVMDVFPETGPSRPTKDHKNDGCMYHASQVLRGSTCNDNGGSAARFFYTAKASRAERNRGLPKDMSCAHPTVKPLALMRYLCKLSRTPTGGVILDPFMGSGTTGIAAIMEDRSFVGMETERDYIEIAKARIRSVQNQIK